MRTHSHTEAEPCTHSKMEKLAVLDLLECPLCLERLDVSAKVLPCQDTSWKPSLHQQETSRPGAKIELHCPECHTLVQARSVEELPPNLLVRLLKGLNQGSMGPGRDRNKPSARYMVSSARGREAQQQHQKQQQQNPHSDQQHRERQPGKNEVSSL